MVSETPLYAIFHAVYKCRYCHFIQSVAHPCLLTSVAQWHTVHVAVSRVAEFCRVIFRSDKMLFLALSGMLFSYFIWQSCRLLFLSASEKLVAVCFSSPVAHRLLLTSVSEAHFCMIIQSLAFLYKSSCFRQLF